MRTRTPREVIELYNFELWNKQNYAVGREIIADEVIRHYPGSTAILSQDEAIQRVKGTYEDVFSAIEFKIHKLTTEGEYVTLIWEMIAKTREQEDFVYSSIEVFRVVEGKICEFWNPIHTEEPTGRWG